MRSELLTLTGQSVVTAHEDACGSYLVQTTPDEPGYWMGNQVIMPDVSRSASVLFALFERHFPKAEHRAIVWDVPNLDPALIPAELADLGAKVEGVDALSLNGPLNDVPVPDGIHIRSLSGAEDWAKVLDLQVAIGMEEGFKLVSYRDDYLKPRNIARRAQIAKGLGQWFGAFDGQTLAASMGIFHDAEIARYQQVETSERYRRRGICSALLRHAALWALGRAPKAQVVIVAEVDKPAGRLYRSMGFAHTETIYGAIRPIDEVGLSAAVT